MSKSFAWDVFVSHNRKQKPWVRCAVEQMRELRIRVFFDEDSIEPGEPTITGIERGILGSRHVALIISRSSMKSRWVAMEIANTLYIDPDSSDRRLIPVVLESTDQLIIPLAVRSLNRIDLTDPLTRDQQYNRLITLLKPNCKDLPSPPAWGRSGNASTMPKSTSSASLERGTINALDSEPIADVTRVVLKIDRSFDSFSTKDKNQLVLAIRSLLGMTDVTVIKIEKGSVLLTVEIAGYQADMLLNAVMKGRFAEHGVSSASKLLPKAPPQSPRLMVAIGDNTVVIKPPARANFNVSVDLRTAAATFDLEVLDRLILDLSETITIDSTFLGVMAGIALKRKGPKVQLINPNERITELLENIGVGHLFDVRKGSTGKEVPQSSFETFGIPRTKEDITRSCLEAHRMLMELNPENAARFRDVTEYLREDLAG